LLLKWCGFIFLLFFFILSSDVVVGLDDDASVDALAFPSILPEPSHIVVQPDHELSESEIAPTAISSEFIPSEFVESRMIRVPRSLVLIKSVGSLDSMDTALTSQYRCGLTGSFWFFFSFLKEN
jgi:hypothetical protein